MNSKSITIAVPEAMAAELERLIEEIDTDRSKYIRRLIRADLAERKRRKIAKLNDLKAAS